MALKIRLARGGARKKPHYSIVVADSRAPRDGRFIEKIGTYDPRLAKDSGQRIQFSEERVRYWLERGALPTDRVARFLGSAEIIAMPERRNPQKAEPKAKAQAREAAKAEAAEAAKTAAAAPAEPVAEEAPEPAEEAPAEPAEEAPAEPAAEAPAEPAEADADEAKTD